MLAPRKFPIEIKAGGSLIRILRDPVRVPRRRPNEAAPPRGKSARRRKATHKEYNSFLVYYYKGSRRIRIRRGSYEKARAVADEIAVQLRNDDSAAQQISGREQRVYLAALDNLRGLDTPLDHATKEYADAVRVLKPFGLVLTTAVAQLGDALKRLDGASLLSAVDFFERHGRVVQARKMVPEVVAELLASLEADGAGKYHMRDMERRLGRFAAAFPGLIPNITTSAINEWLRGLKSLSRKKDSGEASGEPLDATTRNHYRNAVVQLFNFAREHHYLPRDLQTAAQGTKQVKEVTSENEIFSPEEMKRLLTGAPARLIPGMAVKAFAGVRTEEIAEIDWSHILFDQNCIKLPADITKLGQRRLIHLHDNLKAWLEPHRQAAGRLCERWSTPQSVFQSWARHAAKLGIHVGDNKFRNSFISYRVAETHNVGLVALESGNSPEVIQREYLEITTPQEAAKWFSLFPPPNPGKK